MKIYLDTSVYNRPFDDQTQPRIWLEGLSFAIILQMVEMGELMLVTSSILEYENSRNPNDMRRKWMVQCLSLAQEHLLVDETILKRARELEQAGIKSMDALHVSAAESSDCSFFITCDERVIKRYQGTTLRILDPIQFVVEVTGGQK